MTISKEILDEQLYANLRQARHLIAAWRDELLNETMFRNMAHARAVIRAWATDFNETRPHSALGYQTPMEFADHLTTATDTRAVLRQKAKRAASYTTRWGTTNSIVIRPQTVGLRKRKTKTPGAGS